MPLTHVLQIDWNRFTGEYQVIEKEMNLSDKIYPLVHYWILFCSESKERCQDFIKKHYPNYKHYNIVYGIEKD